MAVGGGGDVGNAVLTLLLDTSQFDKDFATLTGRTADLSNKLKAFPGLGNFTKDTRESTAATGKLNTELDAVKTRLREIRAIQAENARLFGKGLPAIVANQNKALTEEANRLERSLGGVAAPTNALEKVFARFGGVTDRLNSKLAGLGLTGRDLAVILGAGFLSSGVALLAQQLIQAAAAAIRFTIEAAKMAQQLAALNIATEELFGKGTERIREFAAAAAESLGLSERETLAAANRFGVFFKNLGLGPEIIDDLSTSLITLGKALSRSSGDIFTTEQGIEAIFALLRGEVDPIEKFGISVKESTAKLALQQAGLGKVTGELTRQQAAIGGILSLLDKSSEAYRIFLRLQEEVPDNASKARASLEDLKTEWGKGFGPAINSAIGFIADFVGAITTAIKALGDFIDKIIEFGNAADQKIKQGVDAALAALDRFAQQEFNLDLGFDVDDEDVKKRLAELRKLSDKELRDIANSTVDELHLPDEFIGLAEKVLKERGKLVDITGELITKEKLLADASVKTALAQGQLASAHKDELSNLEQLRDAHIRLSRAIQDGEREVARAEEDLRRARIDGARDNEDARRRLDEAYIDRNQKIGDALEKLGEVEVQNTRALVDAHKRLDKARKDGQRSIRDAEEALSDARIDQARRVKDAEQDLAKARQDRADAILDATLSIGQALRKGDIDAERSARLELTRARRSESLKKAEEDLDRARADKKKDIARLERDLAEERIDVAEEIADAEENLRRVIEDNAKRAADAKKALARVVEETAKRIEEAQRNLARQEEETNRKLFDTRQRLEDAMRNAVEHIQDATTAMDDLEDKFGNINLTMQEILDKIIEMKVLLGQITLINPLTGIPIPFPGNASGGNVFAGQPGFVGEKGTELFIPNTNGRIISNDQLVKVLREMMGGRASGGPSITINEVANDPEATAFAVWARTLSNVNN